MSIQSADLESIDPIILEEFPYPVALLYRRLLDTHDSAERAELCLQTFRASIRAIAFAIIIRYLSDPPEIINDRQLNNYVKEHLKSFRVQHWIKLLQMALQAYRNHYETFFMPELYDLYWDRSGTELIQQVEGPWDWLDKLARLDNSIQDDLLNGASAANELLGILRRLMRHFAFMRSYHLWYVRENDHQHLIVEVWRGQHKSVRRFRSDQIRQPAINKVRAGRFYVRSPNFALMELHPLIVSEDAIHYVNQLIQRDVVAPYEDAALYERFVDRDNVVLKDDEIVYHLLRSGHEGRGSDELVALFQQLYQHRLAHKQQSYRSRLPLTTENLRLACQRFSEEQIKSAEDKYIDKAYVERQGLNAVLDAFLEAEAPALVISGSQGVGKSILLVHYYRRVLAERKQVLTLWFDGARLATSRPLVMSLLTAWDRTIIFGDLPNEDEAAYHALRDILNSYMPAGPLILLIDGVNENDQPMEAFGRINDFLLEFGAAMWVKVILTTRPQVWQYTRSRFLKLKFKPHNYYHNPPEQLAANVRVEHESVVLSRYRHEEFMEAFAKYAEFYRIVDPVLDDLSPSVREAIYEPLSLRLLCEAHREQHIHPNLQVGDIIDRLANQDVESGKLEPKDLELLKDLIVPQFFPLGAEPVARLTRSMLTRVAVTSNRTLDDMVSDTTEYVDRTPVNYRVERLMNAGWLVRIGSWSDYELRFRYEFFYDHFVGEHLYETAKGGSADRKRAYYGQLIGFLTTLPFVWGPLRRALWLELESLDGPDFIMALARETEAPALEAQYLQDLLIAVMIDYGAKDRELVELLCNELLFGRLDSWISRLRNRPHGYRFAVTVAAALELEAVLKKAVFHHDAYIQDAVMHSILIMYSTNPNLSMEVLKHFIRSVRRGLLIAPSNLYRALTVSALLFMNYYLAQDGPQRRAELMATWQGAFRPSRGKFAKFLNLAFLSILRRLLPVLINYVILRVAQTAEESKGFFTAADIRASFPLPDEVKPSLRVMLEHFRYAMDANRMHEFVFEELQPHIEAILLSKDERIRRNVVVAYVIFSSMLPWLKRDPTKNSQMLRYLFDKAVTHHSDMMMEATPLVNVLVMATNSTRIPSDSGDMDTIIGNYGYLAYKYEEIWSGRSRGIKSRYIFSELNPYASLYYSCYSTLDAPYLKPYIGLLVERQDFAKFRLILHHLATVAIIAIENNPVKSPSVLLHLLDVTLDAMRRTPALQAEEFSDAIIKAFVNLKHLDPIGAISLLESQDADLVSDLMKQRILAARRTPEISRIATSIFAFFAVTSTYADDPLGREMMQRFLSDFISGRSATSGLVSFVTSCFDVALTRLV